MTNEIIAHNACIEAIDLETALKVGTIKLAGMLWKIREERLYETEYGSWSAYCEEFRSLSPSYISKMVTSYKAWAIDWQLSEQKLAQIPIKTLYIALRGTNAPKTKEDAHELIETLSQAASTDIEALAKDPNCEHTELVTFQVCTHCNKKWRI